MNKNRPLTAKQKAFVENYVNNPDCQWNATKSALMAGYSAKCASLCGHNNIIKYNVKQAIFAKQAKNEAKVEYNRERAWLEYDEVLSLAVAKGDLASANTAIRGKARLYGLDIDKHAGEVDWFVGQRPPDTDEAIRRSKALAEATSAPVMADNTENTKLLPSNTNKHSTDKTDTQAKEINNDTAKTCRPTDKCGEVQVQPQPDGEGRTGDCDKYTYPLPDAQPLLD